MNNKQKRTFNMIFEEPTRADVSWAEIESLFGSLGACISERAGSRVAVSLNGAVAIFHRPHPERVTDKGSLKAVRKFITQAGVKIDD